jgi:hypothetical protein
MRKRLLYVCFALVVTRAPDRAYAQFTDSRTYTNSPVGINQVELAYVYEHSDTSIDTSLIVGGAKFNVNQGIITYTRSFDLFHHLTWFEPSFPIAGLAGSISGTNINGSVTGTGDSDYQIGMLLKGGRALSVSAFETYKPTTTVGVSLTFTAPTGRYDQNKLFNLGSDRWSFKPEVGVSKPFGQEQKWAIDSYVNSYFFTDNTSYRGLEILKQRPLPGVEAHFSYTFSNAVWASLDTRYSFRGDTLVNGVNQNDAQRNFILGSEVNVSLNARNTLVFVLAKALVHKNGPSIDGFAVRYDYTWGKGYR